MRLFRVLLYFDRLGERVHRVAKGHMAANAFFVFPTRVGLEPF